VKHQRPRIWWLEYGKTPINHLTLGIVHNNVSEANAPCRVCNPPDLLEFIDDNPGIRRNGNASSSAAQPGPRYFQRRSTKRQEQEIVSIGYESDIVRSEADGRR